MHGAGNRIPSHSAFVASTRSERLWFWAGLAFVAAAIGFLELLDPYYFCQDDALSLELPVVLMCYRGIWQGMSPTYIPYIFLGSPTPSIDGVYPPMYLAYGIARHLLGDEYATFDVFAAMHLLVGYCLTFLLARRLGIGPVLATLASLTFVLSGPVLVMARCWHSFTVLAVFIPLFALFADWLRIGPVTWRWPVALGVALGAYYHSGFPQLFVLGCGFLLLHAGGLALLGLLPRRRLLWLVPALAFGAAISIPVFYQQWRLSRDVSLDASGGGEGVVNNLLSMLLPYPLVQGTLPNGWGNLNLQWSGHFYYFGTVLLAAFLAALAIVLRLIVGRRSALNDLSESARLKLALAMPAVVAFLLSLGKFGGLWLLMGLLPFGLRNNPFRAMPWLVFYACLPGALFLEEFIASSGAIAGQTMEQRRSRLRAAVAGTGAMLIVLHLTRMGIAFFVYGFQPYPQLPHPLAEMLGPDAGGRQQRIFSFAVRRSTDPSYPLVLPHNLPCEYQVPAVFGYDPLVERFGRYRSCIEKLRARPQVAMAAYGVRWLLAHRTTWGGWEPQTPHPFERKIQFLDLLQTLGDNVQDNERRSLGQLDEILAVIEIPDPAPLAFDAARPTKALPLEMSVSGLDVVLDAEPEPRRIVANFLWYPDMVAAADGEPAEVLEDEWQRIVVQTPANARRISIRYAPPKAPGMAMALILSLVGAASLIVCHRGLAGR